MHQDFRNKMSLLITIKSSVRYNGKSVVQMCVLVYKQTQEIGLLTIF